MFIRKKIQLDVGTYTSCLRWAPIYVEFTDSDFGQFIYDKNYFWGMYHDTFTIPPSNYNNAEIYSDPIKCYIADGVLVFKGYISFSDYCTGNTIYLYGTNTSSGIDNSNMQITCPLGSVTDATGSLSSRFFWWNRYSKVFHLHDKFESISGSMSHMTVHGTTSFVADQGVFDKKGYISVNGYGYLEIPTGVETFEFCIKPGDTLKNTWNTEHTLVAGLNKYSEINWRISIVSKGSDTYQLVLRTISGFSATTENFTLTPVAGSIAYDWHHLGFDISSNYTFKIYVNGSPLNPISAVPDGFHTRLFVGGLPGQTNYAGGIDELRIMSGLSDFNHEYPDLFNLTATNLQNWTTQLQIGDLEIPEKLAFYCWGQKLSINGFATLSNRATDVSCLGSTVDCGGQEIGTEQSITVTNEGHWGTYLNGSVVQGIGMLLGDKD